MLALLDGTFTPDDDHVAERFSRSFLAEVPPDQIRALADAVADQLAWALEIVDSDRALTDDEITARLHGSFVAQVPPEQFRNGVAAARAWAPLAVRAYEGTPPGTGVIVRAGIRTCEELRLTLEVAPEAPHRVVGLAYRTAPPCALG